MSSDESGTIACLGLKVYFMGDHPNGHRTVESFSYHNLYGEDDSKYKTLNKLSKMFDSVVVIE
jgi:hypothetical protein